MQVIKETSNSEYDRILGQYIFTIRSMYTLKVCKIANALGITLLNEILRQSMVRNGESLVINKTANGVEISTADPEFEKVMKAYPKVRHNYTNAWRKLAK